MRRTPLAVIATLTAVSLTAACSGGDDGSDDPSTDAASPSTSASASDSASPSESASPAFEPAKAKIAPRLLPKVAQPGPKAAPADDAQHVVLASLTPAQPTREVVLQQSTDKGWKQVAKATENADGDVSFAVADPEAGDLRVSAPKVDGSPAVTAALTDEQVTAGMADTGFADEFDGDAISDEWKLLSKTYKPEAKRTCARSSESAVKVKDGQLALSVIHDKREEDTCEAKSKDGEKLGDFDYRLHALLSTADNYSFTYGVASARLKFYEPKGQHASFWLWPAGSDYEKDAGAEKSGAEVDVIEWFGKGEKGDDIRSYAYWNDPDERKATAGGPVKDPDQYLANKDDSWYDRYHVFTVEWTPEAYTFLIDGHVTMRLTEGVSGIAEQLRLSILAGDFELKFAGDPEEKLPQSMDVDWVRVWEAPAA